MLKPWGGQENSLFPLKCDSCGHHSTRGEEEKVFFPAKSFALVVIKRRKGTTHFYLSIGLFKKG